MVDAFVYRKIKIEVRDLLLNEVLTVEDSRIIFNVVKSIDSFPNKAVISIYNPSAEFLNFASSENLKIDILTAFLNEEYQLLFTGDIRRTSSVNIENDMIFTIEAGDSEKTMIEAFLNKSYISAVQKKRIILDCINAFSDIDILSNTLSKITGTYNGGFVAFNKVVDILDIVIKGLNLEWSIQNNQLIITEEGETDNFDFSIITFEENLYKKPIPLQDGGFILDCVLNAIYEPHKSIFISEKDYEGLYQIRQVVSNGDNKNNNWRSVITCK